MNGAASYLWANSSCVYPVELAFTMRTFCMVLRSPCTHGRETYTLLWAAGYPEGTASSSVFEVEPTTWCVWPHPFIKSCGEEISYSLHIQTFEITACQVWPMVSSTTCIWPSIWNVCIYLGLFLANNFWAQQVPNLSLSSTKYCLPKEDLMTCIWKTEVHGKLKLHSHRLFLEAGIFCLP